MTTREILELYEAARNGLDAVMEWDVDEWRKRVANTGEGANVYGDVCHVEQVYSADSADYVGTRVLLALDNGVCIAADSSLMAVEAWSGLRRVSVTERMNSAVADIVREINEAGGGLNG